MAVSGSIQKLNSDVVNQIAAGEVLQRPASALKELLDNSIDAGATQISVTVKDGGIKILQVQDNGHGVQAADLPLLCERHATSKLRSFDELAGIPTLGFRGEALASVSFVAHLTVTTMMHGQKHGMRVRYSNGRLLDSEPCAATPGTIMLVEDLFYSMPARQKALLNTRDEYARMLHNVGQYAVFNPHIGFSIRRQGRPPDLQTKAGTSQLENVRRVHDPSLAASLLQLSCTSEGFDPAASVNDEPLAFSAKGFMSSASANVNRSTLSLRVNGRLVSCSLLKRALEAAYASVAPTAKPFVILDLQLPASHVDVNVHPTKEEVAILHQERLIEALCEAVKAQLTNDARTQQKGGASTQAQPSAARAAGGRVVSAAHVRADFHCQTLQSAARRSPYVGHGGSMARREAGPQEFDPDEDFTALQTEVAAEAHEGTSGVLRAHAVVGMVGSSRCLVQHQSGLYLLDLHALSLDLVYQLVLLHHGSLRSVQLDGHAPVQQLLRLSLASKAQCSTGSPGATLDQEAAAAAAAGALQQHAELLAREFAIGIRDGCLVELPDMLGGVLPRLSRLPDFLLQIAAGLTLDRRECIRNTAQAVAQLYACDNTRRWHSEGESHTGISAAISTSAQAALLSLAREYVKPSGSRANDGSVVMLTSLDILYRVFERC